MARELPVVAAITVHRNDLSGLQRTCASFDAQNYPLRRQLVIDGASTDGSVEWLETDGQAPERSFDSRPDAGIFDAMNRGLRLAEADVVTFLNAGDRLPDPGVLDFVAQAWAVEDWRWGVGAIRYVSPEGEDQGIYCARPIDSRRFELGRNFIPHPGAYFELAFAREVGDFRPEFSVAADQEHMLRALRASPPAEWDRVMSDFEAAGASGSISRWRTETLLHRIRGAHGAYVLNSAPLDRAYGMSLAAFREMREAAKKARASLTQTLARP